MSTLEENIALDGGWADIEQLTPKTRIGYTNNFVMIETKDADGNVGVYNLPHVPSERMADFLAWLADL